MADIQDPSYIQELARQQEKREEERREQARQALSQEYDPSMVPQPGMAVPDTFGSYQQWTKQYYDFLSAVETLSAQAEERKRLTEKALEDVEERIGEANAKFFPWAFGFPYNDLLTSFDGDPGSGGKWVRHLDTTIVPSRDNSEQVVALDFSIRDGDGVDRSVYFEHPGLQQSGSQVIGIRYETEDGDIHIASYTKVGPVLFPGVTGPPYVNAANAILNGTAVPG